MSNQHRGFLVTRELKMEIYRQAAAKESCSKGLLEHLSEGNTTSVDVHEFDLYFLNSLCKTVRWIKLKVSHVVLYRRKTLKMLPFPNKLWASLSH